MKHKATLASVLILIIGSISCNSQITKKDGELKTGSLNVTVYYFHFTRRCATCMSVEQNARKAVETLYALELKTGEYSFKALNLDEDDTKEIAKNLGVGGQTLLVVRGDKKIDITDKGFLNANNPEKMKEEIRSAVDKVLF